MHILNISTSPLFAGLTEAETTRLLTELNSRERSYQKGTVIVGYGDRLTQIGIISEGSVNIVRCGSDGDRTIVSTLRSGDIFGEAISCSDGTGSPVSAEAASDIIIVWMNTPSISASSHAGFSPQSVFTLNLLRIMSEKIIAFNTRIHVLSQKTIRGKLICFLSELSMKNKSNTIKLKMSRGELADFLGTDRSALSREMANLRREGIISFEGSLFVLNHGTDSVQ